MDKNDKKLKKDTVKEVLTTSSFEYTDDIQRRLVNEKGKINLSFGMRCFFWIILSAIFILLLNVFGLNLRIKNCCDGIVVEIQEQFKTYEEELFDVCKEQSLVFKDSLLVDKLNESPQKVLTILDKAQREESEAFYVKTNGEVYGVDKKGYLKVDDDKKVYSELQSFLKKEGNFVESDKWFYELEDQKYKKLTGFKVYNADGSLSGVIAYTNAISNPIKMMNDIYLTTREMNFYIYDANNQLIFTNNKAQEALDTTFNEINSVNGKISKIRLKKDLDKNEIGEPDLQTVRLNKNKSIGSVIAQLAKNVGNALKKDSLRYYSYSYDERTGYIVFLNYKNTIVNTERNLVFFFITGVSIFLLALYVMTYFYKYSKKHAEQMLKINLGAIITMILVSGIFQFVSYRISSTHLAMEEGVILGDAFYTEVKPEEYLEYAAFINHINLDDEIATKSKITINNFGDYYKRFGIEQATADLIVNRSYISTGINNIIEKNGVFVRLKKSGGENYLNFESVTKTFVRNHNAWIKVSGRIEIDVYQKLKKIVTNFGDYDNFEIYIADKTFEINDNTKLYKQKTKSEMKESELSTEKVEVDKRMMATKFKLNFDGFSYIVTIKNYDVVFIFIIIAIGLALLLAMYINIRYRIENTKDEEVQDTRYKHLISEWLSGNITVINESDRDKEAEYDEILLERLRKTNIERLSHLKKENMTSSQSDDDEDDIYEKMKKEKDIFGISLFKNKRTKWKEVSSREESDDEKTNITELKESIVSSMQSAEEENDKIFDSEKMKVAEERLAIKEVLNEIEENKNVTIVDEERYELPDVASFDQELELSSKDEKFDKKYEKKK